MKELLLVGVGNMGRPYLDAARELGLWVRAIETPAWRGTIPPEAGVVEVMAEADRHNRALDELWAGGVYRVLKAGVPDGVLGFAESHVLAAALAQELLGLPGPSLPAAVLSRNKALQRARFAAAGIAVPAFHLADTARAAADWAAGHLPAVIKPLSSSGSFGVELVTSQAELEHCVRQRAGESPLLAEEAVEGPEFSWEGFIRDGQVIFGNFTRKVVTPPPRFIETGHYCGYDFGSPALREAAADFVVGAVSALGAKTCVIHLEFWLTNSGFVLGEIAVRTPGDYLFDLIGLAYNFNPYQLAIQLAMGMAVDLPGSVTPGRHTSVWFPTAHPGTVTAIDGVDQTRQHPGIERVKLDISPGDTVPDLLSSRHRIGYVLINTNSENQRDEALEFARKNIRVATA